MSKAYNSLDMGSLLLVLEGYKVGPRLCRVLTRFWDGHTMYVRQSRFYGKAIRAERGVTQGDIVSPTLFNLVVDAVVRRWRQLQPQLLLAPVKLNGSFCANDGHIEGTSFARVQEGLRHLAVLFHSFGMKLNTSKTKSMVGYPGTSPTAWSSPSYLQHQKVCCPVEGCDIYLRKLSVARHLSRQHARYAVTNPEPRFSLGPGILRTLQITDGPRTNCPFLDCPASSRRRANMRKHFMHRHPEATLCFTNEDERDCVHSLHGFVPSS